MPHIIGRHWVWFVLFTVASVLAPLTTALGDAETAQQVEIKKFKFIPQEITIKAGETILWTNREKRQYHSVWFEQAEDPEPDYIFPDETYERIFEKPGSYPYRCGPHPKMTGIVHVE